MDSINTVICLAMADTEKNAQALDAKLSQAVQSLSDRHGQDVLRLGFGRVCIKNEDLQVSYWEAKKVLRSMTNGLQKHRSLHYYELGIYRLFFEIKNTDEIRKYYMENLGPLLSADEKNGSELLATLRCYLYSNCNLLHTAKALFIHRNTLIYRLNIIRTLLKKDLNEAFVRHELFNSILAAEFMYQTD